MPRRPDAELVKTSKFHELQFYIMRGRNESAIHFDTLIDLTHPLEFIEKYNKNRKEEEKLSLFQLFLTAGVRTVALRYRINRFISGRRLWQRNQIIISFVVKKEKTEEGEEVNAVIEFDPFDTLETVQKIVYGEIYEARHGENKNDKDVKFYGALPRWLIGFIFRFVRWMDEHNHPLYSIQKGVPLWSTAYIAHLGSLGIEAVHHHLFELGNAGLFVVIGKKHKRPVFDEETGKTTIKEVMELRVNIDDRIADGSYLGPTIDLLKNLIEHPEPLLTPPKLTDEQLDKLMLKKYKKERLQREKIRRKQKKKK